MRPLLIRASTLLSMSAAIAMTACGNDNPPYTGPAGTGTMNVRLKDTPFPYDSVQAVTVFVVRVDAKRTQADSTDAASGAATSAANGWVTIASPNKAYNLLDLQNGNTVTLGHVAVMADSYQSLRLVIDPAQSSMQLRNGTMLSGSSPLLFPTSVRSAFLVTLDRPVQVMASQSTDVLVDFNVAQCWTPLSVVQLVAGFRFNAALSAVVTLP